MAAIGLTSPLLAAGDGYVRNNPSGARLRLGDSGIVARLGEGQIDYAWTDLTWYLESSRLLILKTNTAGVCIPLAKRHLTPEWAAYLRQLGQHR